MKRGLIFLKVSVNDNVGFSGRAGKSCIMIDT